MPELRPLLLFAAESFVTIPPPAITWLSVDTIFGRLALRGPAWWDTIVSKVFVSSSPRPLLKRVPLTGLAETIRRYRLLSGALSGALVLAEYGVFRWLSQPAGLVLFAFTVGLSFSIIRLQRVTNTVHKQERDAEREKSRESFYRDDETGLPNRQNLIETLGRDISRSIRRSEALTLAIVSISRFDDLRAAWGNDTGPRAVAHVSGTLLRITRNSDFLARLDTDHFAVLLVGCTQEQASIFADRVTLAVTNRPLEATGKMRVPVYVDVEVQTLQYDSSRYRGPLEFLSAAGGDVAPERRPVNIAEASAAKKKATPNATPIRVTASADAPSLRRQLLGADYHQNGKALEFAEAYQSFRSKVRRTG